MPKGFISKITMLKRVNDRPVFFFFFFSTNSAREKLKLRVVISLLLLLMFLFVVITGVTWTTAGCGEEQVGNREEKVSKCPGWKGSFSNYLVSWFWLKKKNNNNNDQLVFYTSTVIIQWNSSVRTRFLPQLLCKLKADVNQCGKVSANNWLFHQQHFVSTTTTTISVKRCKITYWLDACITV